MTEPLTRPKYKICGNSVLPSEDFLRSQTGTSWVDDTVTLVKGKSK